MTTRRQLLRVAAIGGVGGFAGCSEPSEPSNDSSPGGSSTGTPTPEVVAPGSISPEEIQQFAPADGGDQFGYTATLQGDTAFVGVPDDNDSKGSVYVLTRESEGWELSTQLTADDSSMFGFSVALTGETALIGAPRSQNEDGVYSGTVYEYTQSDSGWVQSTKIAPESGERYGWFGRSIAATEETALISEVSEDTVYVFTREGDSWQQQTTLTENDGDTDDSFGRSVALAGDTAIVGAEADDEPFGDKTGAAYVFIRGEDGWSRETVLATEDGNDFGESVAVEGDTVLIGDPEEEEHGEESGAAYIYTRNDNSWQQQTRLTAEEGEREDAFGHSVSLQGGIALIGAYDQNDPNGEDSGAAHVFTRTAEGWQRATKFAPDDGKPDDAFSWDVSMTDRTAIITAYTANDLAGKAYMYTL